MGHDVEEEDQQGFKEEDEDDYSEAFPRPAGAAMLRKSSARFSRGHKA